MTREEMMQEVDRRTHDLLIDHLFARSIDLHAKNEWGVCVCTYCMEKRRATHYVGLAVYPLGYSGERPKPAKVEWYIDPDTLKIVGPNDGVVKQRRDAIREWYRQRLDNLKNQVIDCRCDMPFDIYTHWKDEHVD